MEENDIFQASASGNLTKIKNCLASGFEINERDSDGYTLLHWAVQEGQIHIVKFLVENGANINCKDEDGFTPLEIACAKGHISIVEFLLSQGCDLTMDRRLYPITCFRSLRKI